ncbi:Hypothetical predicted protein [Podarcis lilfordi]|uniref:Uncharacterized protein n=1 Tax=Podarcis lilfordi TaxID=74358 RepID=A0AA35K129_9SAUR|nr:Hypothetical predicted protein [Podarcis lilfordi]
MAKIPTTKTCCGYEVGPSCTHSTWPLCGRVTRSFQVRRSPKSGPENGKKLQKHPSTDRILLLLVLVSLAWPWHRVPGVVHLTSACSDIGHSCPHWAMHSPGAKVVGAQPLHWGDVGAARALESQCLWSVFSVMVTNHT